MHAAGRAGWAQSGPDGCNGRILANHGTSKLVLTKSEYYL